MFNLFFHIFDSFNYFRDRKMKKIYTDQIRDFINSIVPITDIDWDSFYRRLIYKEYKKNELFVQVGEIENYMYFLVDGVTRIYHYKNGTEYTLRFNFPITAFNSYASFICRTPSSINIEALTEVKVLRMSYPDMQSLYEEAAIADRVGRRIIELLYIQRERKEIQMHSRTAEDYYYELVKDKKDFIQQIPQKHLASYLGITPESLSRIRSKITKD